MPAAIIFQIQLALGYLPWLLLFVTYLWPRLRAMDSVAAHRLIATLHSFRFFGLVFLVPGVVGPGLLPGFAASAAYGDLAAGLLAMLALLSVRVRPLFLMFVVAFNVVGAADLILNYVHGVRLDLPGAAGALGAAYWIPILYVPILMITHVAALRLLLLRRISPEAQTA
jgi:hypothetical protein